MTQAMPQPAAAGSPGDRILATARSLFAERGFSRVTMRCIASSVGLHNSSLFHHFSSKAEISQRVFDGVLGRLLPRIEALGEDDPPSLDFFVERLLDVGDHFIDEPDDARFLLRVIVDPDVFLASYVRELDRDDASHPLVRLFTIVWGWLDRARRSGAIRPVLVYQATRNLFGILLFEPTYGFGESPPGASTNDPVLHRRQRLTELEAFVRGALAPTGGQR